MRENERRAAEVELERLFGVPALFVNRASAGLYEVLTRISPRPVVALSPIICQDVLAAIVDSGSTPYFVDIDPDTGHVAPGEWTKASLFGASVALVVHLYGLEEDMTEVRAAFSSHDCLIVEDAAQALGARAEGKLLGARGDIGLLSFGGSKHLQTGGGAVLSSMPDVLDSLRAGPALEQSTPKEAEMAYANFRSQLDEARRELHGSGSVASTSFVGMLREYGPAIRSAAPVSAAGSLLSELPDIERRRVQRIRKVDLWAELLRGLSMEVRPATEGSSPWRCVARLPGITWVEQGRLADNLRLEGIPVSTWYVPAHWYLSGPRDDLPGAEQFAREVFQFWIDEATSHDQIAEWGNRVRAVLERQGY